MSKGGGGGQSAPSNSTVTQTTVPEELIPYLQRTVQRAEAISNTPYEAYTGQRLADFSDATKASFEGVIANQGSYQPYLNTAGSALDAAMSATQGILGANARDVSSSMAGAVSGGNMAGGVTSSNASSVFGGNRVRDAAAAGIAASIGAGGRARDVGSSLGSVSIGSVSGGGKARDVSTSGWDVADHDAYMNPYLENVLAAQQARMQDIYDQENAAFQQKVGAAGAFGGSRHAVLEAINHDKYRQQVNETEAKGRYDAYMTGLSAFQTDKARDLQAQMSNQDSDNQAAARAVQASIANQQRDLARAQMALQADMANQNADLNYEGRGLQAALANQQSQQNYLDQRFQAGLQNQQADIEFEGRNLQAGLANQASENDYLARMLQSGLANQSSENAWLDRNMQAGLANQSSENDYLSRMLQSSLANQSSDNAYLDRALQASGQMAGYADQAAGLGKLRSQMGYTDAEALRNVGLTQEQLQQAGLDLSYNDFTNQRDYDRQNLAFLSGILRGTPMPVSSEVTNTQYSNPYAQAMGLGLGLFGAGQN